MCTVTFLPLSNTGFILTSNRDEQYSRLPALPPQEYVIGDISVVFPKDGQAGGTWIATSGNVTVCLLNGAFEAHQSKPPYRQSRGLMMLDFFGYESPEVFVEQYNFTNLEPFTLLVVEHRNALLLTEIRWTDTGSLHIAEKDAHQPHLWSSATLYPASVGAEREQWFANWLTRQPNYQREDIVHFHEFGGTGDEANDLRMRRSSVATVSITSVRHQTNETRLWYKDLKNGQTIECLLSAIVA